MLAALRKGQGLLTGQKVLIVLDQFEQWLHASREEGSGELVEALRQCDGEHVQCVLMVRDDFWMAATRFLRELEVRLTEGQNAAAVDRFDLAHAAKVVADFGRSYGRLPAGAEALSAEQMAFLDAAVGILAQDGKVISVQLSLFAEMVKAKPWTPATLKAVGGSEGLGIEFLEETFSAKSSPPEHRLHQKAARAVLSALLPADGIEIKGHMKSYAELRVASGYVQGPEPFHALMRLLDTELRLVTPADPEGLDAESPGAIVPGERYYRLAHDYLVPSLREWLTRKQKETARGRAELLLAERANLWQSRPDWVRPLSAMEWLTIRLYTRRTKWSKAERGLMNRSSPILLILLIVAIMGLPTAYVISTITAQHKEKVFVLRGTKWIPAGTEIRHGRVFIESTLLFSVYSDDTPRVFVPDDDKDPAPTSEQQRERQREWEERQRRLPLLIVATTIGAGSTSTTSGVPALVSTMHASDVVFVRSRALALEDCFEVVEESKKVVPYNAIFLPGQSSGADADGRPRWTGHLDGRMFKYPLEQGALLTEDHLARRYVDSTEHLYRLKKRIESLGADDKCTRDILDSAFALENDCESLRTKNRHMSNHLVLLFGASTAAFLFFFLGLHRGRIGMMWSALASRILPREDTARRWLLALFIGCFGGAIGTRLIREALVVAFGLEIRNPDQDYVTLGEMFIGSVFISGMLVGKAAFNPGRTGLLFGLILGLLMVPFIAGGEQGQFIPFIVLCCLVIAPIGAFFGSILGRQTRLTADDDKNRAYPLPLWLDPQLSFGCGLWILMVSVALLTYLWLRP
jgi:hypothetical protein